MNKTLIYIVAALSALGLIFNIVQIIIIINGGYNRNPAIQPEWLQTLDAIGLTLFFAVLSLALLIGSIWQIRRTA
jgi:hypothetical protein